MEESIIFGLILIIAIILSIWITFLFSKKKISKEIIERGTRSEIFDSVEKFKNEFYESEEYKESQNLKYERGKEDGKNEAIIRFKESEEFRSFIEHKYSQGIETGKNEALASYKSSIEYEAILTNEFYRGRKEGIEEALKGYKESPEYQKVLENEYRKGKEQGQKEEMSKFKIKFDIWNDYNDGFFNQHYIDGYNMQLFYNNMPIGEPTRRVLTSKKKFKEDNLKYLVDNLKYAVEKYIEISSGIGIAAQLLTKEPKKIESNINVD